MKRIFFLLATLALCAAPAARAQDAATQERLDKLAGRIEDLENARDALKKQMSELRREMESVREQSSKPNTSYARQEELNLLTEKIREVDNKRIEDADKVKSELLKLREILKTPPPAAKPKSSSSSKEKTTSDKPAGDEKVFEYTIQSRDTLAAIVQAYKEKGVKVTVSQILKANPGLNADHLRVGQKIVIPVPPS
jgi:nucleoid-associated protein YgaU